MDVSQYVVGAAALIGLINGFRLLSQKDKTPFFYFLGAVVGGALLGYVRYFGIPSVEIGLLVGLSSSGFYRVGQVAGGK